ncbi:MAG: MMPL family transporter, partial [Dehalococcoidia bacterium]|nr:MMPL family transporter [Dehalococcoidia bacterium]
MFASLGRFIYRFRWLSIVIWLVIFLGSGAYTAGTTSAFNAGGFTANMESVRAADSLTKELKRNRTSVVMIFKSDRLTVDDAAYKQAVEKALGEVKQLPPVGEITSFYSSGRSQLVSPNRRVTYASIGLDVDPDNPGSIIGEIGRIRADPVTVILTGDIVVYADIDSVAHQDLIKAEMITFPVVLLILLAVFGTAVAAGLSVAMGAAAVTATLAALYFLTHYIDLSIFAMNISTMLGLGLG